MTDRTKLVLIDSAICLALAFGIGLILGVAL